MPSLVRAAFTSLPPVWLSTVSERVSRGRANAISASHSASVSRLPNTSTRGSFMLVSTRTGWPSPITSTGEPVSTGSGTALAGGSCAICGVRAVVTAAWGLISLRRWRSVASIAFERHRFVPAAALHRGQHGFGLAAGFGLRHDPAPKFFGDVLGARRHGDIFAQAGVAFQCGPGCVRPVCGAPARA